MILIRNRDEMKRYLRNRVDMLDAQYRVDRDIATKSIRAGICEALNLIYLWKRDELQEALFPEEWHVPV